MAPSPYAIRTCSLEEKLQSMKVLFDDENPSVANGDLSSISELLYMVQQEICPRDNAMFKSVASFIRDIAAFCPNVCHILLIHLPLLPDPIPFIEIIPAVFCVTSPSLLAEVTKQLKSLCRSNHRLLLPVIATLTELPLPSELLFDLNEFIESAIDVVDEGDLPLLCRTLFKSLTSTRGEQAVLLLRSEVCFCTHKIPVLLIYGVPYCHIIRLLLNAYSRFPYRYTFHTY